MKMTAHIIMPSKTMPSKSLPSKVMTSNKIPADFYEFLHRLHGHRCPMSIMGARLGLAAREHVGVHGIDGDVSATYMHQTCALDGIMAALGTTPGNNNIVIEPKGLHCLEAINKKFAVRVRIILTEEALALGRRYGDLRRAGTGKNEQEELLKTLETMPDNEAVEVSIFPLQPNTGDS
jgi:formylmethanofuran dehydrogenase subunit E